MKTGKARHSHIIENEARGRCPGAAELRKAIDITLEREGAKGRIAVGLLLTDSKRIRALNRRFLGRDRATDVIAFPDSRRLRPDKRLTGFIGELAVSADAARQNSRRFGSTFKEELLLYVIHGVLHLLGYPDKTARERRSMERRQNRILKEVCRRLILQKV